MNIMHKMYTFGRLVSYVEPVLNATSKHTTIKLLFILLCTYLLKMSLPMMSCYIHMCCDQELTTRSIYVTII